MFSFSIAEATKTLISCQIRHISGNISLLFPRVIRHLYWIKSCSAWLIDCLSVLLLTWWKIVSAVKPTWWMNTCAPRGLMSKTARRKVSRYRLSSSVRIVLKRSVKTRLTLRSTLCKETSRPSRDAWSIKVCKPRISEQKEIMTQTQTE